MATVRETYVTALIDVSADSDLSEAVDPEASNVIGSDGEGRSIIPIGIKTPVTTNTGFYLQRETDGEFVRFAPGGVARLFSSSTTVKGFCAFDAFEAYQLKDCRLKIEMVGAEAADREFVFVYKKT